jgi:hypothetical protein
VLQRALLLLPLTISPLASFARLPTDPQPAAAPARAGGQPLTKALEGRQQQQQQQQQQLATVAPNCLPAP